jgi:hypothetical protein
MSRKNLDEDGLIESTPKEEYWFTPSEEDNESLWEDMREVREHMRAQDDLDEALEAEKQAEKFNRENPPRNNIANDNWDWWPKFLVFGVFAAFLSTCGTG